MITSPRKSAVGFLINKFVSGPAMFMVAQIDPIYETKFLPLIKLSTMKKVLFALLLLFVKISLYAQVDTTFVKYCEIIGYPVFATSYNYNVYVDSGQVLKKDNMMQLNSMTEALNMMDKKGWDFVQAYSINQYKSESIHFILRRRNINLVGKGSRNPK